MDVSKINDGRIHDEMVKAVLRGSMPLPRSGELHIVLTPSYDRVSVRRRIRSAVTLYSTVRVSATPPTVFKLMV